MKKAGLRHIYRCNSTPYDLVRLYDPHPGFAGAAVPLPKAMKDAADKMDGKRMMLEEAVEKLSSVAKKVGGKIELVEEYNYIGFSMRARGSTFSPFLGNIQYLSHNYRLIRYK